MLLIAVPQDADNAPAAGQFRPLKGSGSDILALDADRVWNGNLHDVFSVETRLSL